MRRRFGAAVAALLLMVGAGCAEDSASPPHPESGPEAPRPARTLPPVEVLGVLGDSISLGVNACDRTGPCPKQAWAGGDSPEVSSVANRLTKSTGKAPRVIVAAKDGGGVADAADRVDALVAADPDLVTILIGANDACAPHTSEMMSAEEFRERFASLLETLETRSSNTVVLAMSIPDLGQIWSLGKDNRRAIQLWSSFYGCRNLLRDPTSSDPEVENSRQAVVQRVIAFNEIIEQECKAVATCVTDNGELFQHEFTVDEISGIDFFHPSADGQRSIADIAWNSLTRQVAIS